jgi:hypothetical protein
VTPTIPFEPSAPDILKQSLTVLRLPAVGSLILGNPEKSSVKQLAESNMLGLDLNHGFIPSLCLERQVTLSFR